MKSTRGLSRFIFFVTVFLYFSTFRAAAISSISLPNQKHVLSTLRPLDSITNNKIKSIAEFSACLRDANGVLLKFKDRKHLLKVQLRAIRQSPDKTRNQKVLLTILAVLAFIGVVAVLGIIGYNGLAGLWPVVGLVLSIFLLVFVLKRIWRRKDKNS